MGTGISKASTAMAMMRTAFSKTLVIDKERQALTAIALSRDDAEIIIVPIPKGAHSEGGKMEKTSWEKLEGEQLNKLISRQMLSGDNATIARLLMTRGAVVPRHSHVSEQFSLILSGALKFVFDDREVVVRGGEVLYIPANVPHSAVALEDTVDLDFFAPRREDWIRKEDAYLREQHV
jgi:quercetin dioxygenase-like cupin family protein